MPVSTLGIHLMTVVDQRVTVSEVRAFLVVELQDAWADPEAIYIGTACLNGTDFLVFEVHDELV